MEFQEEDGASLIVSEAQVVTRASVVAAERLGLSTGNLAAILDVPEDTVSRMERLEHLARKGTPAFQRTLLLIRLFRSVNVVAAGDESWSARGSTTPMPRWAAFPPKRSSLRMDWPTSLPASRAVIFWPRQSAAMFARRPDHPIDASVSRSSAIPSPSSVSSSP